MKATQRLLLDLGVFAGMVVAFYPGFTGITVHEWLSLAIIVPAIFHLIINWDATMSFVNRFAGRISSVSRANLVVDAALFIAAVAAMLSGFMVSHAIAAVLGIASAGNALWAAVHAVSADATIALLLAHFALHGRWLFSTALRISDEPASRTR